MNDERAIDRLIAHLRTHVADLRRMERDGADPRELEERKRLIITLQSQLAYAVRDLVHQRPAPLAQATH